MSEERPVLKVLLTGAAGQIGYSIVFMIANGCAFGEKYNVHLVMLDLPVCEDIMKGVRLELEDCAFNKLVQVDVCTNEEEAFKDIDVAILVAGAMALTENMQRRDLLAANKEIYVRQAGYLDKHAKKTCKVLVVANPANTNCLILTQNSKNIPKENFTCLTRLDQNRARNYIAKKLGLNAHHIKKPVVWGNHSSSMVPDIDHAEVYKNNVMVGKAKEMINDIKWIKENFVPDIKERSKAVITFRKRSSALSAAYASCNHLNDWINGTGKDEYVSMGVLSNGEYGIEKDIIYAFPCTCKDGKYTIVQGLTISPEIKEQMLASAKELVDERSMII